MPPSLVLEALQILEAEVNLREDTRVAEQAKPAITPAEFVGRAESLSTTQSDLMGRVNELVSQIEALPNAGDFGTEYQLLTTVSQVMQDATTILARPDTGSEAIAAETEVIELLLQSKRINPSGGGGGGSQPGGGGTGTTTDSAMSLVGGGMNAKEVTEDHGISQSTGENGRVLPEEFRAGLDEYFNRLEDSLPAAP